MNALRTLIVGAGLFLVLLPAQDTLRAEEAADQVLSLPAFPEMTTQEQDEVIACVTDFFLAE